MISSHKNATGIFRNPVYKTIHCSRLRVCLRVKQQNILYVFIHLQDAKYNNHVKTSVPVLFYVGWLEIDILLSINNNYTHEWMHFLHRDKYGFVVSKTGISSLSFFFFFFSLIYYYHDSRVHYLLVDQSVRIALCDHSGSILIAYCTFILYFIVPIHGTRFQMA